MEQKTYIVYFKILFTLFLYIWFLNSNVNALQEVWNTPFIEIKRSYNIDNIEDIWNSNTDVNLIIQRIEDNIQNEIEKVNLNEIYWSWFIHEPQTIIYNNSLLNQFNNYKQTFIEEVIVTWFDLENSEDSDIMNSFIEQKLDYNIIEKAKLIKNNFTPWHCTWYVAEEKEVFWLWNAKDWINNAKKAWAKTWKIPKERSIVVFFWKWYNTTYWHVALVEKVNNDWTLTISEMNAKRLWWISTRKIKSNDYRILWFIYTNDKK